MHLSVGGLLQSIHATETTPPLYFVCAWIWARLFGVGELGLRSFSALAGTALIPILYLCGRELVSRRAGVMAAALAAVNPFMIWYSQEARAYMLLGLLCGASFLFFARSRRNPSPRNLALWAVCSALALLTHFFAGFLIAPEAMALMWRSRRRASFVAAAVVAMVQLALIPLALGDSARGFDWLTRIPLAIRIKQVPVEFLLGGLYQSSAVNWGLIGAAGLGAGVIALLGMGAERQQVAGAICAAAIAGFVLLAPLALSLTGNDYYFARNLMPAWVPVAVVIGAACTVTGMRIPGAILAVTLLAACAWASVKVDQTPQYQRLNFRAVAGALGAATSKRAIVAYDGVDAAWPLSVYLPAIPWNPPVHSRSAIHELDIVGSSWQTRAQRLPRGVSLISSRVLDEFVVERFRISPAWRLTLGAIAARASRMLGPAPPGPAVLIQAPRPPMPMTAGPRAASPPAAARGG
jgi:mannosyltransferase